MEETMDFIKYNENEIYFFDEKEECMEQLESFWKAYPDGMIKFG